jgi:cytochrome c553
MKKIIFSLLIGFGLGAVQTAEAASVEAGKGKSAVCAACHGSSGKSAIPMYPHLAGQKAEYIVKQLKAFKAGDRVDPTMAPMAAGLSEEDMADLAAYFSSLPWSDAPAETAAPAASSSSDTSSSVPAATTAPVVVNKSMAFHNGGNASDGQAKSAACSACHGVDGNSLVPMYPKLAGQGASYIAKQLADFKSSTRKDPLMAGMVAGLSEQDMADLGAFYATQKTSAGDGKTSDLGQQLYFGGDFSRDISACVACHTASGQGVSQAKFPSIAGQNVDYLTKQLKTFRTGERENDNNSIMRKIAVKLSDADIAALAQFMSSLK